MNLYIISNPAPNRCSYTDAIIVAQNPIGAIFIHPNKEKKDWNGNADREWCIAQDVEVRHIGVALPDFKKGVIEAFGVDA